MIKLLFIGKDLAELKKFEKKLYNMIKDAIKVVKPCTMCGTCCHLVGRIYISPPEALRISNYLGKPIKTFAKLYNDDVPSLALRKHKDGRCIFLDEDGTCKIYKVRPFQCRTYPVLFTPVAFTDPIYAGYMDGYYYFKCVTGECVIKIRIDDFYELLTKRVLYNSDIYFTYMAISRVLSNF